LSLGATNASAITLGRTGITTTNPGSLTVTQTLTANALFDANGQIDLGDGGDVITISGSDTNIAVVDGSTINIDGDGSPTSDILQLGSGDTSSTDGVDALQLTFGVSAASGNIIDITPSYTDATAGSTSESYYIIDIDAFTATQNALGDTGDIRGLNIGNLTQTETAGTITASAIRIGTGWDDILNYNGTTVINNTGQLVASQLTGTLFTLDGDDADTEAITQGNTLLIAGGANGIDTDVSATDTITLNFDSTEVGTTTWASGTGFTWTFDAGATDPTIAFASNAITFTAATNTFAGNIAIGANTLSGSTAVIDFTDFDLSADGLITFASDGAGDQIYITTPAADFQALVVDATTNDSTQTAGMIDLNVDSSTNGAVLGLYLTATAVNDNAADTLYGNRTDIVVQDDTTASDTFYGHYIDITQNDTTPATVYGLAIVANDAGTSPVSGGILIDNLQATDIDLTDAILIRATTADSIVDAIDVSDPEITNGINLGNNNLIIAGDTINDFTGNGALTVSGNALILDATVSGDGLSTTTSAGSGLEVLPTGLTLLQGCSDGQVLKWNETTDTWDCSADATGSATPGGSDTQIQYNNAGSFGGTSSLTFNNSTLELTATDDFTFSLGGTENIDITNTTQGAADLVSIASTWTSDTSADALAITTTYNVSASTSTVYGLNLTNADNGANTGIIDALALFSNDQATETLADGVIIRHNAASGTLSDALQIENTTAGGTITNAINIVETAGTITTGINIGSGVGTAIVLQNGESIDNSTNNQINLNLGAAGTLLLTSSTSSTISNSAGSIILDSTGGTIDINDAVIDIATQATDLEIIDNTASAFTISQGTNSYLNISTTDTTTSLTLDLPVAGSTSTTGNLFTSNVAKTINIGTGTAADTINIGTGGTSADTLTFGNASVATTFDFNSGASTTDPMDLAFNSVTTANGIDLSLNALTSGYGLNINSTSTSLTSGRLLSLDWSPGSSTTATGDLFRLNIGSNGNVTNLLNITDASSTLFRVSENQIESAIPHSFTAAGDVAVAYDIVFTNQTASTIDSYGPLTIRSGESFENNNLTLSTYGTGKIIIDGGLSINSQETISGATPSVGGASYFITNNTAATTVTNFTDGTAGQIIVIEINDANTTFDCTANTNFNCGTTDIAGAAGDIATWIYDGSVWNLVSFQNASANHNDNDGFDIAEYYPSTQALLPGEIVKVDPERPEHVIRSSSAYESSVVGIVSTNPGITLGENDGSKYAIALAGRVPVRISSSSADITPGDYITTSSEPGKAAKATGNGRVIGQALESWTRQSGKSEIIVFINNTWYEPIQFTDSGDLSNVKIAEDPNNPGYALLTDKEGNVVNKLSGLVSIIAENIKSGFLEVNKLVTTEMLSKKIKTSEIAIDNSLSTDELAMAKILFKNSEDKIIASIDESGNANFEGSITGENLSIENNATISGKLTTEQLSATTASISGELRAEKIVADEIVGLDAKFADLKANTGAGISREEIESLLRKVEEDQKILSAVDTWSIDTATESASIDRLALEDIYVTGQAAFQTISISESLILGNDLVISYSDGDHPLVGINTISTPISLQSSASQPLYIMAGLIQIDTNGNVQIAGNLNVAGKIQTSQIELTKSSNVDSALAIIDDGGNQIAGISSSGSAKFKDIATDVFTITEDASASQSATLAGVVYESKSSAGVATIPQGEKGVKIKTPVVKESSLIFITPKSSTGGYSLYIKSQQEGEFEVGFSYETEFDIPFNWWVVNTRN
jgi:hypothetical protein